MQLKIAMLLAAAVGSSAAIVSTHSAPLPREITFRCDGPTVVDFTVAIHYERGEPVGYRNSKGDVVNIPNGCWPLTAGPLIKENK